MGEAERKLGGEGRKSGAGGKRRLSLAASCKRRGGAVAEKGLNTRSLGPRAGRPLRRAKKNQSAHLSLQLFPVRPSEFMNCGVGWSLERGGGSAWMLMVSRSVSLYPDPGDSTSSPEKKTRKNEARGPRRRQETRFRVAFFLPLSHFFFN